MNFFRFLSRLMMLGAIGLALFDLVREWVLRANVKIRSVEEVWTWISKPGFDKGHAVVKALLPPGMWEKIAVMPAPLVLFILAIFFYVIFRLLNLISGRGRASRL